MVKAIFIVAIAKIVTSGGLGRFGKAQRLPAGVKKLFFAHYKKSAGKVYCLSAASFDFSRGYKRQKIVLA
ncbi:MAG: hypothetical protein IIZ87_07415 [Selenomonas sp.]|nr:hypothetical protein [Selenomonas sp.]